MPVDTVLAELGLNFTKFITDMKYATGSEYANACRRNALEVLRDIEKRSAYLIETGA
jgi:hypothetical protein